MMTIYSATGEEALIWGALKSNIGFISSTTDPFSKYASKIPLFEPPINYVGNNGKIVTEQALGASFSGMRALVFLDNDEFCLTLNSISVTSFSGIKAGVVLVVRDDPGAWNLQTEQDMRTLIPFIGLPLMEPASPQEGYAMVKAAFSLSEQYRLLIIIRITSNFLWRKEDIEIDEAPASHQENYVVNEKYITQANNALEYHEQQLKKLDELRNVFEQSTFNRIVGGGNHRIIVSGPVALKLLAVLGSKIATDFTILKLATLYPFPGKILEHFLKNASRVLILEENEPFMENMVKQKVHEHNIPVVIYGRSSGDVPLVGELFKWQLEEIIKRFKPDFEAEGFFFPYQEKKFRTDPGSLCFGCAYFPIVNMLKEYLTRCNPQDLPVIIGDPGCAMRLAEKHFELLQIVSATGAAINIAAGMARSINDRRLVAITDDKSFFHSGVSALIDGYFSEANILLIIFDTQRVMLAKNRAAHTEQPSPISIKKIITGIGVDFIRIIKSDNLAAFEMALLDGMHYSGLAVIVIENKCTL